MNTNNRITCKRVDRRLRGPRQTGVSLVEFTLIIPFALLFVLGIIQTGLLYSAKELLNEGTFMAARAGAMQNAKPDEIRKAMTKALIPFYQDTSNNIDYLRLANALRDAGDDTNCSTPNSCFLTIDVLNPTPAAFTDFGRTGSGLGGRTYIPNDNLEYRSRAPGLASGLTIQDANVLKIKVTYGYEIKVPLMKFVMRSVMCGVRMGVDAFDGTTPGGDASATDCTKYYSQGRVPLVSFATVQMQSPAVRN